MTYPVLEPLPDAERLVSAFLRADARIAAAIGERVYTVFPSKAGTEPLLIVQRIGGLPPFSQPLVLDAADLQCDSYGGSKAEAHDLAALARAVLTELEGAATALGNVSAVRFGMFRYQPDETYAPPRPRFVFDVTVYTRTPVAPGALARRIEPSGEPVSLPG